MKSQCDGKKDKTWFWVDLSNFHFCIFDKFLKVLVLFRGKNPPLCFSFGRYCFVSKSSGSPCTCSRESEDEFSNETRGDTIQLVDRGSRGGVAGQKESRGERTTAHAIITSFCFYCRRRIKLSWGSVVKSEVCFSGTCSCSICLSSVKPCSYVPHYFLHVLSLALIPPFIAPLCPPHFKDSSSLFSHRGGIFSTHHAFFLTQFSFPHLSCPPAPSFPPFTWPQLILDFSFSSAHS